MPPRGVTSATVEASLSDEIKLTRQWEIYERNLTKLSAEIDLGAFKTELLSMHATRSVRSLNSSEVLANAQMRLIDANCQNQAFRSRCVEMRFFMSMNWDAMEELQDAFHNWATAAYAQELEVKRIKSEAAKWSFVASLIEKLVKRMKRVASLMGVADQIIADIDAAGYSLMRVQKACELQLQDRYAS